MRPRAVPAAFAAVRTQISVLAPKFVEGEAAATYVSLVGVKVTGGAPQPLPFAVPIDPPYWIVPANAGLIPPIPRIGRATRSTPKTRMRRAAFIIGTRSLGAAQERGANRLSDREIARRMVGGRALRVRAGVFSGAWRRLKAGASRKPASAMEPRRVESVRRRPPSNRLLPQLFSSGPQIDHSPNYVSVGKNPL